ncbi:MAG: hypothetical protein K9G39_08460 [Chlorobium sp.]|uniref:hypothetical protein n=1 Tax=Chlorobium sp. TaxID=1095 RepID=UPI0025BB8CD8|nr:hypothetical protein [Chlorobium sp.]MCF8383605.1 hypothetical protein [Chlorobium sp.]
MLKKTNLLYWFVTSLFLLVICGCGSTSPRTPIYSAAGFQMESIPQLAILPPYDSRFDKKEKVDIKKVQEKSSKMIQKKGYVITEVPVGVEAVRIDEDELKSPNKVFINNLCPAEKNRYIMVINILDVSTKLTFGSTGNAEISGYVFDKDAGITVWHDKGIGSTGQGGLLGMIMKSGMDDEAISIALYNLFSSIPEKKAVQ